MSNWQDFTGELGRKMLDQAQLAIQRFETKEIGLLELKRTIGAVYDTASGLAPQEDLQVVAAIYDKVEKACERQLSKRCVD
ncbi:hypothetical protein FHV99_004591 [Ochrobactrum sp. P20RRXII]|nr:hypothetical protein [Ochrobactrum sp. P20RRXII]NIH77339.1 hypothetical protein [Ochrobactrum sp. P20RRXII]